AQRSRRRCISQCGSEASRYAKLLRSSMPQIEQVEALFHEALTLPSGVDRRRWVEARCQRDSGMLEEVLSLLDANSEMMHAAAVPPAPEPVIPTAQFGAYRAVRLIGRGGMSTVYLARRADGQFDQTVALKIMAAYLACPEF